MANTLPPRVPSPSQPMFIPTRNQRSRENEHSHTGRRHTGMRPAVAALLAVTSIPPPSRKPKPARRRASEEIFYGPTTPPSPYDYGVTIADEVTETTDVLDELPRNSTKSVLEILLSPPDEADELDYGEMERTRSDGSLSARSDSSDSVPSLEADNESTYSFNSSCSATSRRRGGGDARSRIISSPPEECDFNHPLMALAPEKPVATNEMPALDPNDTLKRVARRLNLKSNLTASIRVLRSAAKSFTSLTASPTQYDDYITRSILSITPQYTDERRPAPSAGVPTPAVRRYLNPWGTIYDDSPCTGAIQMQTYSSGRKSAKSAGRNRGIEPDTSASAVGTNFVRQREVRENGDFLRVIVLEMNMRREGKLRESAQGRARLMLPPRQPCKLRTLGNPGHWEALVCIYEEED